jgi:hypothetical protein
MIGSKSSKIWRFVPRAFSNLPAAGPEVERLIALKKQLYEVLKLQSVESVGVIRADRNSSPIRAKVECVIQFAASEASISCRLIAAQTVAAADKRRVNVVAGAKMEQILHEVRPGYLRKAAHCAWRAGGPPNSWVPHSIASCAIEWVSAAGELARPIPNAKRVESTTGSHP